MVKYDSQFYAIIGEDKMFRYWRGCRVQGSRQEQVVISEQQPKETHPRNHQSFSSHDDGNHLPLVMVKPLLVKPIERNMFVQIFEHILHGTSIQMEQRNHS